MDDGNVPTSGSFEARRSGTGRATPLPEPEVSLMPQLQRTRKDSRVKSAGAVTPGRNSQDVMEFKRAADAYVRKATSSVKNARATMVALGIHTDKGTLTRHYK